MKRKQDVNLKALISEATKEASSGTTWTAFCTKKDMTAAKMRTALFRASQEYKLPIPVWVSKRGARADQKITVQKKGIVILSKGRLPDAWETGDSLEITTTKDKVIIKKT